MPKKSGPKLQTNILVPFLGPDAEEIKGMAAANGMPTTMLARLLLIRGLETVKEGKALVLRVPDGN